jgi:hypothetical protein
VDSKHWRPEYTARFPAVRTHARTYRYAMVHHYRYSLVRSIIKGSIINPPLIDKAQRVPRFSEGRYQGGWWRQ